ncbi:trans-aconitate 2-methyltransferase [Pseudomonas mucidolens]|uniref:Trans-aconitate 2-methyltransferase n=1 Tax=Pseudomonas mucidolens TaxID=46679 RepID=A0A1H2P1P0_9PSED|nr:trans-aconitate 2-methyltransferase [Pseudomonas mucidolens]SDV11617.1 trans-aconitate 2-methyltransferase [Pseudomonas mucidolens]SQH36567.1 trans-aconitate 2-methyltransferase [Pseudomonas mucidolens]
MTWSAKQYSMFEQQRTRPVRDLVAAIPEMAVRAAVDLGCGPGNSTEILAQRFPNATVTGLDSSEDMLVSARERLPALHFELADIGTWNPAQKVDVILANASLQWLPDHATLYPHLAEQLAPGGVLAVQTPDNLNEPAHAVAREVAADVRWAGKIGTVKHNERHTASYYFELLGRCCDTVDVWRTTYHHPLSDHGAVVEWFKASALRPFLAPLDDAEKSAFLDTYLARITEAYPALEDGSVLLAFPRLFIIATR